ncbi:RagB/SusD family nutrient uptake outer membrane protein [uncultured Maribacter sp.]|uniref:RagB/SusD family nutrient uptake outer membrane protein n=1 Tax=uncultured Maribacter sp. TaxID=431308 RepID=UPI0030ECAB5B|tara:strand:- start:13003 stop:14466 length:1464 start_codon:yes stop_codon:yes gene_type:complete
MKRFSLFFVFLTVILVGCESYLDEVPKDRLSDELFYQSKSDAQSAINAIYAPLLEAGLFGETYYAELESMSDYATGRGSYIPVGQYQGLDPTNANRTAGFWSRFYRSINFSNIALEKIPSMDILENDKQELLAEAKFMRAFCYYHLVVNFGDVPLYLGSEEATEDALPRSPVDKVYEAIISDLQDAEAVLPSTEAQFGHPSKWSAKSLLALIYLTNENWALAKAKAGEVIDSGMYSLVDVEVADDFNALYGAGANGSSEEIFYIKYNNQVGTGWPFFMLWDKTIYAPFGAFVLYSTTDYPFISEWDDNDLRKQFNIFSEYVNRNTGEIETLPASTPVLCSKYRDPAAPGNRSFSNDLPFMKYSDILLLYAEAASQESNGPTSTAIEYLNMIKRRAYGYPASSVSAVDYPSTGWTESSFLDAVLKERGYEQYMEGKRWLDLKRLGIVEEVILNAKGFNVLDTHLLWPIPEQEIQTNPLINQENQNPGY